MDHFGDAGVAWRLARQLRHEVGAEVFLYLDHLPTLAALVPTCDVSAPAQELEGVWVVRWDPLLRPLAYTQVVLETFGCEVPPDALQAMARQHPAPVWINLEYLSAEPWVEHCHRLPSPHPRLPLTRYFFFPGFTPHTGGLLREASLLAQRDRFQNDPLAIENFWHRLHCPAPSTETTVISLFGYDGRELPKLLHAWHDGPMPIRCLIPAADGLAPGALAFLQQQSGSRAEILGPAPQDLPQVAPRVGLQRWGALEWVVLPFLAQPDYDPLLWACHFNLVRGEDSFVRAQWAARPLLWQIYPQPEEAHWIKLEAFLDRYLAGLPAPVAQAWRALFLAWNGRGALAPAWRALWPYRHRLQTHAQAWARTLSATPDLASQLVQFAKSLL